MNVPINGALEAARSFADEHKKEKPKRANAIDCIWNAAMTLIEADKAVTAAAVGRLSYEVGGPNGHSIRKNPDYSKIVKMLAQVKPKRSSRTRIKDDQILKVIGNEADRSRVRQIIEERNQLRGQMAWLKKAVREDIYEENAAVATTVNNELLEAAPEIPIKINPEWNKFLNSDFWENLDCKVTRDGVYLEITKIISFEALDDLAVLMGRPSMNED